MTEPVSQGVLGTLGIDGFKFAAQLFNYAIVLFVMWRFVYRPLLQIMDKRSKEIRDGLKHAQDAKVRLADAQIEKERILKDARTEAQNVIKEAQEKADAVRQEKMAQAKAEIEKIVSETKMQIRQERDAAFAALKGEIGSLVTLAMGKVMTKIDPATHRELINEAVKELEKAS